MEPDDDVPLILTWDDANSGLLNEETERGDESECMLSHPQYIILNNTEIICMSRPTTLGSAFIIATILHLMNDAIFDQIIHTNLKMLASLKPVQSSVDDLL